tara:strand:+ start:6202 stop:7521 length:1320 start_codon:yes stop_codon:yes gene_type:complete
MSLFSKITFNRENYISLLLALFPFSFIAGNMIININLALLIISSIILFKLDIFKIKFFLLDKFLISYFFLIILTALVNDYYFFSEKMSWKGYFSTVVKSIFFLKYLLLYLVLRFLTERKVIKFKLFFILCSAAAIFVSLDIFYQFFYGKDIFGFVGQNRKLSGPFGDEFIAGGFIQRYSLFAFFLLPIFFSNHKLNKYNKYFIPILFIIFFSALIMTGNRMPTIVFLFSVTLILIFQKQTRKFLIPFVIIFSLIFSILFKSNITVRNNFLSFYAEISKMTQLVADKDFFNKNSNWYLKEFSSFYHTWLINKYIGGGIKNFRYYCHVRPQIVKDPNFVCNMHPHNYYLEILTETGVIGFTLVIIIFLYILYLSFIKKYFLNSNLKNNNLIIPFIFIFLAEIFPLKSTGSFFTTGNSTYLFLLIGIIIGLARQQNLIENKI